MSQTIVLTPEQIQRLSQLVQEGWELKSVPYAHFSARRPDVMMTLYLSGKLVLSGKGLQEFVEMVLEPEILQEVVSKKALDSRWRIGVDEAGKGDYFGPLVVAGVSAGGDRLDELIRMGVRDSKTMSDPQIMVMAEKIRKAVRYALVVMDPERYNEMYLKFGNLNHLLAWGHAQAIRALWQEEKVELARIDQFAAPWVVESALKKQGVTLKLEQQTKGESDPVIAAASILARAGFLEGLQRCAKLIHHPLPKGAGSPVLEAAKDLIQTQGTDVLGRVAKLHFKTTKIITA